MTNYTDWHDTTDQRKPRKPRTPSTEPAKGTAKWVTKPVKGIGVLQITSETKTGSVTEQYAVSEYLHPDGSGVYGYKLRKEDGTTYDISIPDQVYNGRWECECPDAVYNDRPNTCKHCAGVRAAFAKLGIENPAEPVLTHDEVQEAIDNQIIYARAFRVEKGYPPMTPLEESNFRDRLRQAYAR